MRKKERIYEDDDGRTIADMSGIEPQPMLIPRIRRRRDERNAAIGGALKAGLLIGGVFLIAGALAILAMQALWS